MNISELLDAIAQRAKGLPLDVVVSLVDYDEIMRRDVPIRHTQLSECDGRYCLHLIIKELDLDSAKSRVL